MSADFMELERAVIVSMPLKKFLDASFFFFSRFLLLIFIFIFFSK